MVECIAYVVVLGVGLSAYGARQCVVPVCVERVLASAVSVFVLAVSAICGRADWCVGSVAQRCQVVLTWHMRGGICWWVEPRGCSFAPG